MSATIIFGMNGSDEKTAAGVTTFYGGAGADGLTTNVPGTVFYGGGDDDTVALGFNDGAFLTAYGGEGNDALFGGDSTTIDRLYGGTGNDYLDGGNGNDWIYGGAGANTLIGGFGNDTFFVDSASDTVVEYAGGGTDFVRTSVSLALSAAAEVENLHVADLNQVTALSLTGSDSANFIVGNAGDNLLKGLSGNDVLAGFHGNDRLEGGLGNDTIDAYVGDDVLAGGAGKDALKGGEGRDAFVFDTAPNASTNLDTIADFSHADDTIRIDNAVFKAAGKNGKLVKDAFVSAKKALDAEDRFIYDKASGALSYDADGTGKIAAIKIAILQNKVKIDHTDFLVI